MVVFFVFNALNQFHDCWPSLCLERSLRSSMFKAPLRLETSLSTHQSLYQTFFWTKVKMSGNVTCIECAPLCFNASNVKGTLELGACLRQNFWRMIFISKYSPDICATQTNQRRQRRATIYGSSLDWLGTIGGEKIQGSTS